MADADLRRDVTQRDQALAVFGCAGCGIKGIVAQPDGVKPGAVTAMLQGQDIAVRGM